MKPRRRLIIGVALVASIAVAAGFLMSDRQEGITSSEFLHNQVGHGATPAVQYRFFDADSILVRHDAGLADVTNVIPVSAATTYSGFSVTKTFTAVAVLQLAEGGKIDLDRPAADYVPDFPYPDDITVRHLLTHTAGIPNPIPLRWTHLAEEHDAFDQRAFFGRLMAENARVKSRPNDRFRYSNLGFVLLGQLIEEVSGTSYEEYVTDHILSPIGVSAGDLGFRIDVATQAKGYHRRMSLSYLMLGFLIDRGKHMAANEDGWMAFRPYYVNGTPYGGLIGSADGFARYGQALLASPCPLLSEESRRIMFSENVLNDGRPSGMALSWYTGEMDGQRYYAHAGGGGGYYTEVRIYPELGFGSVIMFNRSGMTDERILDRADRDLIASAPQRQASF